jgi:hypothetical protein
MLIFYSTSDHGKTSLLSIARIILVRRQIIFPKPENVISSQLQVYNYRPKEKKLANY